MGHRARLFRMAMMMAVVFFSLGCISISVFVDMDSDASGKGAIYQTVTFPDIGENGASVFDSYVQKLYDEGWEDIEIGSAENGRLELTAKYQMDPSSGRGFPNSFSRFSVKVEEAENGYKYFTFDATYDFTQLSEGWQNFKNSDDGFSIDLGDYFGGEKTYITKQEMENFVQLYGEPTISYKVKLPGNTPVDAKGTWTNTQNYLDGTSDIIEFVWTPDKRPTGTLNVSRRWEPAASVSQADIDQNLANLINKYEQDIPTGFDINILEMPTGGWINNIIFAHFNGEAYTCGSYQNYVIDFLDQIRTSSDPEVRSLLNGLDYGPIQTNGGGHVAVVVYPSGTDWQQTGTVLDPWPTQRPQAYNINTWFLQLGFYAGGGYHPEVSYGMENAYPQLSGKPPSYPAQADMDKNRALPVKQILVINSPVMVMLTMEDGSLAGVNPDWSMTNQMPGDVSFYALPKANDEHSWFFMLPDQTADVYVLGESEGLVHIALVSADKIVGYEAQPISKDEYFIFSIQSNASLSPLQLESGETIPAVSVNRDQFSQFIGQDENSVEVVATPVSSGNAGDSATSYNNDSYDSSTLGVLCLGCCCCFVIIFGVALIFILFIRKRR